MKDRKKPAIRFKGFTEDWEQRKLGELALFNPKDELPQIFEYVDLESVVGTEMLSHRTEIKSSAPSRAQRIARTGDLFYQTVRPYQKNNYLFEKPDNNYVFSTGYAQMRPFVDGYFMLSLVQSERFIKVVLDNCTGTSYPAINSNNLAEIEVYAPSNKKEDNKIGTIFRNIDNLITLHQCKYNYLLRLKDRIFSIIVKTTWEQRKLGDIFKEYSEKDHEELPALMIIQGGGTMRRDESDRSLLYDKANLANYKMVKEGDFIVHLRSFEGGLEKATNTGIISPAYHTLHGENTDSRFYYSYFRSKKFIDVDLKPHVYGIRDGRSIDIEGMKTVKIPFTNYREQKTIGTFIKQLDHLITLHQRKYDKLVNIKKSMLEKIFPHDGKIVPDIRFSGFTEDWEQRKVGDFLTESRVRGNTGLDAKKLTVKLWGKGVVEKNDFGGSEHTQYFTRRKGQFIYSKLDFLNSAFGVIPEKLDNYESTADLPAFDLDGMNPYFMYFVAIQESFYLKHGSIADGSRKAKRIHADTFLNMPVMVPTIDEQNLIVDFLQHLDNLTTLHQRKLEKLRNIKKSCLEKMFI